MKQQFANEVPDFESIEELEKHRRASGICTCGKPVSTQVKNATLCDGCREDVLGDLVAV